MTICIIFPLFPPLVGRDMTIRLRWNSSQVTQVGPRHATEART